MELLQLRYFQKVAELEKVSVDTAAEEVPAEEVTEEIVANQFIEADALDPKTREVLGNEDLVVLS